MSRILKNSNDFTPESIVPDRSRKSPEWGSVAIHIEPYKEQKLPPAEQNHPLPTRETEQPASTVTETSQPEEKQLENDFTVPVSKEKDTDPKQNSPLDREAKPLKQKPSIEEKDEEKQQDPAVDIQALTKEHYDQGLQDGIKQMEADYGAALKALLSSCEQLNTLRDTILRNSIDEMKELVIVLAEKIIRESLASQKETVLRNVEEAIKLAVRSDEFKVFLNPDDIKTIEAHSEELVHSVSGLENIILQPDTSIEPGGCLIESSNCTVDATIASQFELLQQAVIKKS